MKNIEDSQSTSQSYTFDSPQFHVVSENSLSNLDAIALDRLATGRGMFASRAYLTFMEQMWRKKGVWYVTCRRTSTNELVAVVPVYDGGASASSYWDPNRHYRRRALGSCDDPSWADCLYLGIRSGHGWGPLLAPNLSPTELRDIGKQLLDALRGKPLAAMFISDDGRSDMLTLGADPGDFFLAGATSVISLKGMDSFDEYLDSLPKPRKARREIRVCQESGATTTLMPVVEAAEEIAGLFVQLIEKYGRESSIATEIEELHQLHNVVGNAAKSIVMYRGGNPIAGALFIEHEQTLYMRQAGFDYEQTGSGFEYFNLAYYEMVRHAFNNGFTNIDYGMATYRAKIARGATVEPLWGIAIDGNNNSLMTNYQFRHWDAARRHSVEEGTAEALERVELP